MNPNAPSLDEIEKIVQEISEEIVNQIDTDSIDITMISNGFVRRVEFCNIIIWCSEMDEREVLEDGKKEDIATHLRRMVNEEILRLDFIEV